MKKMFEKVASAVLAAALGMTLTAGVAFAQDPVTVEIPVTVSISSTYKPSTAESMQVILEAVDADSPMPEGSTDGAYSVTISGEGSATLGAITYTTPGIYNYTVHQAAGSNSRGTYDSTVYQVKVQITNDKSGNLIASVVSHVDGMDEKPADIAFTNSYTRSSGGGSSHSGGSSSGGSSSSGSTAGSNSGPGVSSSDSGSSSGDPGTSGELTPIGGDPGILGALPQTGTLWWMVPILAVVGILLFAAGFSKSQRQED
ncbi:MAG: hypothetical protein LIO92_12810 [Clostridiales bacterium]|nr:hypothetical protein [Clostridiales bacterium]